MRFFRRQQLPPQRQLVTRIQRSRYFGKDLGIYNEVQMLSSPKHTADVLAAIPSKRALKQMLERHTQAETAAHYKVTATDIGNIVSVLDEIPNELFGAHSSGTVPARGRGTKELHPTTGSLRYASPPYAILLGREKLDAIYARVPRADWNSMSDLAFREKQELLGVQPNEIVALQWIYEEGGEQVLLGATQQVGPTEERIPVDLNGVADQVLAIALQRLDSALDTRVKMAVSRALHEAAEAVAGGRGG